MTRTAIAALILATGVAPAARAADDAPIYELRQYTTAPGKLGVLLDRFGKHNLPIFERHGINLVGAWVADRPGIRAGRARLPRLLPEPRGRQGSLEGLQRRPRVEGVSSARRRRSTAPSSPSVRERLPRPDRLQPGPRTPGEGRLGLDRRPRLHPADLHRQPRQARRPRTPLPRVHTLDLFRSTGWTNDPLHPPDRRRQGGGQHPRLRPPRRPRGRRRLLGRVPRRPRMAARQAKESQARRLRLAAKGRSRST